MLTRRDFLGVMGLAAAGCSTASRRTAAGGGGVDRRAVVGRHSVRVAKVDPERVLSVGNGNFAFNMDCTGLQSLPGAYTLLPLTTMAHWAWHSAPAGMDQGGLRYQEWDFHGRKVPYATSSTGQEALFNYSRENPHKLNLGRIGLVLDGNALLPEQISQVEQWLDLWKGVVTSRFVLAGEAVEVTTCCHGERDGIGVRIASGLLENGRLGVQMEFGYASLASTSDGADWVKKDGHSTEIVSSDADGMRLARRVDVMRYGVRAGWSGQAAARKVAAHRLLITPGGERQWALQVEFLREATPVGGMYGFEEAMESSGRRWADYWQSGAAIDLGGATDPRAGELERRIVLSQYLTAIHCTGEWPAAETGLFCNSWYGKFHLEMHWWHSVHFAAWGRWAAFEKSMGVYARFLESSRARAKQQGFGGARWSKMTSPDGADSPSTIGPLLIWQQPHPIYYAELLWRAKPTRETLEKWGDIVMETAEFMASFAQKDDRAGGGYVLGPAMKTVSENAPPETTFNPTYELTAWRFGLRTAQAWRERLGMPRNAKWDEVLKGLAAAPQRDGFYVMQEGQETFTPEWAYEHPALLGALGVLPGDGIDPAVMAKTVRRVRERWDFARVWGWDFPMCAMAAARTGQPELAVEFLLMDSPMNRYIGNGVNSPRVDIPAYLPGNGGLLSAVAMMAGGWTGAAAGQASPGFPRDGRWSMLAEGFGVWM